MVKLISAVSLIKFIYSCVISTDRCGDKNTKESQNNTSILGFSKMMISINDKIVMVQGKGYGQITISMSKLIKKKHDISSFKL